jgi:hypothetical protein
MSFKQLNRKTFLGYHRDGIVDILIGLTFLGFGFWLLFDNVLFTYIAWLSFGFYRYLKKKITIPRYGYVSFKEDRKQIYILIGFSVALLVLLLTARFYLMGTDLSDLFISTFLRKNHVYVMSSIGAVLLLVVGLWRGIFRLAGYGIFSIGMITAFYLMEIPGRNALFIIGGLILTIGLALLVTFIQDHPILPDEADHAS